MSAAVTVLRALQPRFVNNAGLRVFDRHVLRPLLRMLRACLGRAVDFRGLHVFLNGYNDNRGLR